jgi:methylenetetrahydrofolate--tRNA-(uracil-5-)-methyltransferase
LAGQITGVEGYTESAASGILAGINAVLCQTGAGLALPPRNSMMGSLGHYLTASDPKHFQPINAMWGLVEALDGDAEPKGKVPKYQRYLGYRERGMREFEGWTRTLGLALGDVSGLDAQAAAAALEAESRKAALR